MAQALRQFIQNNLRLPRWLLHVHPNTITIFGIIPSGLIFLFLFLGKPWLALISFSLLSLDALDGLVARQTKRETAFGGFLDSVFDRVADAFITVGFPAAGFVSWPLAVFTLVASFLVSYTRCRGELAGNGKFRLDIGVGERGVRLGILFVGFAASLIVPQFLWLLPAVFWFVSLLSIITIIQRSIETQRQLRRG
jgi:archaetidylinositol phosphate synthase